MTTPINNWRYISKVFPISALSDVGTVRSLEDFIREQQRHGWDSQRRGWVMSEIVEEARQRFGDDQATLVKDMIIAQCVQDTEAPTKSAPTQTQNQ